MSMSTTPENHPQRDVFTVSRLNSEVRVILEGSFPLIWVQGEISNMAQPSSGHIYFSLKDAHAQVRCAMFRMKRQYLRFQPSNGVQVLIRARVSLYEGRGDFQLIVEQMEPAGEGALRQAFEELKRKLAAEGLFDSDRKRPIPTYPACIGIITSPSGAAVQDVLTVLARRCPGIPVIVYPASVQGEGAATELIAALRLANRRRECDLLILTRGGGSLEDLAAFNDEHLARVIRASGIPVIAAVGHEIDFTIADFVADQRAATPSAAAELASPDARELLIRFDQLERRFGLLMQQAISHRNQRLGQLLKRLRPHHPGARLEQRQQRSDELERRLRRALINRLQVDRQRLSSARVRLLANTPRHSLNRYADQLARLSNGLHQGMERQLANSRQRLTVTASMLNTLSPLATLERGYSITRHATLGILHNSERVSIGDELQTQLHQGRITSRVIEVKSDEEP